MLTTSKKWAAVVGFAIVAAAAGAQLPHRAIVASGSAPKPASPASPVAQGPTRVIQEPGRELASSPVREGPPSPPHFDVVRVEPSGEAVVAGTGAPNAAVALLGDGEVLAEARTDAGGHFAVLPPPLRAGDHALTLRQAAAGAAPLVSAQSVAVSVPARGRGPVVVALAEPGSATRLLSPPPEAAPPRATSGTAPAAGLAVLPTAGKDQPVVVRSVELENGSGFYAAGLAPPAAKLRLYLNDAHLADVVAAADGQWSLKIRQGLTGGHYVVRADGSRDGGPVTARAEVPFDVPAAMAAAPRRPSARTFSAQAVPPQPVPASGPIPARDPEREAAAALSQAVIAEVGTAAVRGGDNLWAISRVRLGQGRRYTRIYAANAAQIRDPRLIYPGQVFVLPAAGD